MGTDVLIRRRQDEDLPALAEVLVRVHALDGYPVEGVADPEGWLRHPRELQSWTAESDGTPVGQVTLTRASAEDDAARVWLDQGGASVDDLVIPVRLFVDPDHRGSGAGARLMRAAAQYAAAAGCSVAFDVMEKDVAAVRLYERMGAVRLDSIDHHHSNGSVEPAAVYAVEPGTSAPNSPLGG